MALKNSAVKRIVVLQRGWVVIGGRAVVDDSMFMMINDA